MWKFIAQTSAACGELSRRFAVPAANAGLVLTLAALSTGLLGIRLSEADPCRPSLLLYTVLLLLIPAFLGGTAFSGSAILLGLVGVRIRAFVLGFVSLAVLLIFLSSTLRRPRFDPPLDVSAVAQLRTINTAEVTFYSTVNTFGSITDLIDKGLLDERFATTVSGYKFTAAPAGAGYVAKAIRANKYGCWDYFSTHDAVIRYSTDAAHAPEGQSGQPVQ